MPTDASPNMVASFFFIKIDDIRKDLLKYDLYCQTPSGAPKMCTFDTMSEDEVLKLIRTSRATTSMLDPIPSSFIKDNADILCPLITRIINTSFVSSSFPGRWKSACVKPLLKKKGLELIESNYRPVSNLSYISKILERAALFQLEKHTQSNDLIPVYQSAYRSNHSTETALLHLHHDILSNMESGRVTAFVGLDLSAAFDTVHHEVMLDVLSNKFGITEDVNSWVGSYLRPREFFVHIDGQSSKAVPIDFSVPQGSCLGPVLFTYYSSTLENVVTSRGNDLCGYADDHGVYKSLKSGTPEETAVRLELEQCLLSVRDWMNCNRLKMNTKKTEFICFGSSHQLRKLEMSSIDVCSDIIDRAVHMKYLGCWFDELLSFKFQISYCIKIAMTNVINIRSIRKYLSVDSCRTLVRNLVITHIDYANSLYFGLPQCELKRLQRVQNISAKLILGVSKFSSTTDAFATLHWVPVVYRIQFKIAVLVFKCLNGSAPKYLVDLLVVQQAREGMRSSSQSASVPLLKIPRHRNKTFLDRSFAYSGPFVWNSLPQEIRSCCTIDDFKGKLKTYFCGKAYSA